MAVGYGPQGPKMSWEQRAKASVDAKHFRAALAAKGGSQEPKSQGSDSPVQKRDGTGSTGRSKTGHESAPLNETEFARRQNLCSRGLPSDQAILRLAEVLDLQPRERLLIEATLWADSCAMSYGLCKI